MAQDGIVHTVAGVCPGVPLVGRDAPVVLRVTEGIGRRLPRFVVHRVTVGRPFARRTFSVTAHLATEVGPE